MRGVGIEVDSVHAQNALRILDAMGLTDHTLKFLHNDRNLIIPVKRHPSVNELSEVISCSPEARIVETTFDKSTERLRTIREATERSMPLQMLERLPRSYDIIGDIAIVELNDELDEFAEPIGKGIMQLNPHVRLVVKKTAKTAGQYRTRGIERIAGEGSTETVHHEFSCKLLLDVASVYFNPRLSHERMRIAKQVKIGETIVDMFAGVGPCSILIGKTQPTAKVFSVDLNPIAYKYLAENVFLNKLADRVFPLMGDVRNLVSRKLGNVADRVVMNLPSDSTAFLQTAVALLKPSGGWIHYYVFASRDEGVETTTDVFCKGIEAYGRKVESFGFKRIMKEVAPNRVEICLDAIVH